MKFKGVKKICGASKHLTQGYYLQVSYDVLLNEAYGDLHPLSLLSYSDSMYDDKDWVVFCGNLYGETSMKKIESMIEATIQRKNGYVEKGVEFYESNGYETL